MKTEKHTDGRVILTIQLSGEISGQSINPLFFTVSKVENISPKLRTKEHAQWRLVESMKNALDNTDDLMTRLREKIRALPREGGPTS